MESEDVGLGVASPCGQGDEGGREEGVYPGHQCRRDCLSGSFMRDQADEQRC